jgi:hypothetical protein
LTIARASYHLFCTRWGGEASKGVAIEHIVVSWLSTDASDTIRSAFDYANERNRWSMITIEPAAVEGRRSQLLDDIPAGAYDSRIESVCRSIGALQPPMRVRWATRWKQLINYIHS